MTSPIQGVYAAAVTPRRLGTEDINLGAMWDLIDFLVAHGVQGIVLLGQRANSSTSALPSECE